MDIGREAWVTVGVSVAGLVVLAALLGAVARWTRRRAAARQESEALRSHFGREYELTAARVGHRGARQELGHRMRQYEDLELDRLRPDSREALTERWKEIQYRFLEDPAYSVREAEHLIEVVMRERGYPSGGFDTRVHALSVERPDLAVQYREAHSAFRSVEPGEAGVDPMFRAMDRYREIFEQLLRRPEREQGLEGAEPPVGPEGRRVLDRRAL
jgi:hypothetical protein